MRNIPGWFFLVAILGLFAATILCSGVAFLAAQQFAIDAQRSGIVFQASATQFAVNQPTATQTPQPPSDNNSTAIPTNTLQPGETPAPTLTPTITPTPDPLADYPELTDPRRITILLMGIDQRVGFTTDTAYRSDTMMLISVNPVTKKIGILSIPRDLWVTIPGYQPNRINTANLLGDSDNYPGGGGPKLAADTVEANFGIKVDKYIRINFNVFETVVNTLAPNGIEICINEEIYDPAYPDEGFGFMEVRFSPGCQLLKADRLLQYARTRKTQGGDFDRAMRQQQVLRAAQAEFLSLGGITNFVTQIPTLYTELSNSVVTNLTLDEIIALGRLASEIDQDDITTGVIDVGQVTFAKSNTGDDILIPRYGEIRILLQNVFNPQPPATLADLRQRADAENATVAVYNDTTVAGLAGKTQEYLIGKIEVDTLGNIPEPTNGITRIRDYGSHPWTARYIARLLELPEDRIEVGRDGLITNGVMVVVGEDIQPMLSIALPTPTP